MLLVSSAVLDGSLLHDTRSSPRCWSRATGRAGFTGHGGGSGRHRPPGEAVPGYRLRNVSILTTGSAPSTREPSPGTRGDDLAALCGRALDADGTQPFFTTEPFSGRPASFVPHERLLDEVEAILDGAMDDVPLDELFYRSDRVAGTWTVGRA